MAQSYMSGNTLFEAERAGVVFFQFTQLAAFPELSHQVFSRQGGFSQTPFNELNVAFGVGDRPENVRDNRRQVAKAGDYRYMVYAHQVHGTEILVYTGSLPSAALSEQPRSGDALITDIPGLALVVQVADCQAILLYDPVRRVIANVHAGWRGSIENIAGKTVAAMERQFGCRGRDMAAAIAPSLGPCCAEFIHYRDEIPEKFWKYKLSQNHFDFWKISLDQLVGAGLQRKNVQGGNMCTRCRPDYFYSYRGEARRTGRFAAVIGLRDDLKG